MEVFDPSFLKRLVPLFPWEAGSAPSIVEDEVAVDPAYAGELVHQLDRWTGNRYRAPLVVLRIMYDPLEFCVSPSEPHDLLRDEFDPLQERVETDDGPRILFRKTYRKMTLRRMGCS